MFGATILLTMGTWLPTAAANSAQPTVDPEQQAATAIKKSLGVEFNVAESKFRRSIIRTKTPYGFKIRTVEKNSLADKAGWKEGDIILEWNEQPLNTLTDLNNGVQKSKAGEAGKFKLARYKKDVSIWSRQPWEYVEGKIEVK